MSSPLLDSDFDRHQRESPEEDPEAWAARVLGELGAPSIACEEAAPTAVPETIHQNDDSPADSTPRPSCRLVVTASDSFQQRLWQ